ncbi:MAG: DNA recombination protein RmuC [Candidatus Omnitrophota bacterium]
MNFIILLTGILLSGFGIFFIIFAARDKMRKASAEPLDDAMVDKLKGAFATLSFDALSKNSEHFLQLAQEKFKGLANSADKDLEGKKKLIDQTVIDMRNEMEKVKELMSTLEKDRENKFAQLTLGLGQMTHEASKLQETTQQLRAALANTKTRGQWGERMAEDVLRMAGFVEGINYSKQKAQGDGRPDYTFFLPKGLKVNMDVKFPLDNYLRFFEAQAEMEKQTHKDQFLRDVKNRIKEVTTRDYIDPENQTMEYVIVFIPNEQVYAFINESDRSILDEAMRQRVIFCSPLTLYAILAVIRQAIDNFNLERRAHRILDVLASFEKQYSLFCTSLDKMGSRLEDARKEYETLCTTRKNQMDRQFRKIDQLRKGENDISEVLPQAQVFDQEA